MKEKETNELEIPLLKPVSLKVVIGNNVNNPIGNYQAKKLWNTKYLPLFSQIIEQTKKCNELIKTEGLETENTKIAIYGLNLYLNRESSKKYISLSENYEEVRSFVSNIINSYEINKEEVKNAD